MQELWMQEFDQVRKPKPSEKHVLFSRKKIQISPYFYPVY